MRFANDRNRFTLPPTGGATPWIKLDRAPDMTEQFTFAVLSDRTGLARPGVFEHAIQVTNLLRPEFVVQVGDQIEGAADPAEIEAQWDEFDGMTAELDMPYFRVSGNHDVPNDASQRVWLERHGPLYYAFRYDDVLFLVLDTQDPPEAEDDGAGLAAYEAIAASMGLTLAQLVRRMREDRELAQQAIERSQDWEGRMPARFGEEQLQEVESILARETDARWTFVFMHMPAWQTDEAGLPSPGWERVVDALGDRPYTAISGHVHNYQRRTIGGHDHIRLGPSGGAWVKSGDEGNFDQVMLVTMTAVGPVFANIVIDGVLGVEGGTFDVTPRFGPPASRPD